MTPPMQLPPTGRHAPRREDGFTLMEFIVSGAIMLLVIAGIASIFSSMQDTGRDLQLQMDSQQRARQALTWLQRDLQVAGVGLSRLHPPFPVVIPREDGGVDLRVNRGQLTTFLTRDMSAPGDSLAVDDAAGFAIDYTIAVYDDTGSIELTEITGIRGNTIAHTGLDKAYLTADGTSVARVERITYRVEGAEAPFRLVREVDGGKSAVVAEQVQTLGLTYLDDSAPPAPFVPDTLAEQLRIRMVELQLTIVDEAPRLRDGGVATVEFTARIAPRALTLY